MEYAAAVFDRCGEQLLRRDIYKKNNYTAQKEKEVF
jgi:hypothetical protein